MKIKISAGFTGVLPSGSYANMKPHFGAEYEYEFDEKKGDVLKEVELRQSELHKVCYDKFKSVAELAQVERLKEQKNNLRFHEFVNEEGVTLQYPSVSSIASYNKDFSNIDPFELNQYASHGNLYDLQCKHFIVTGKWEAVEKIQGSYTDLAVLKNGPLRLEVNNFNFPAFLEKFPISEMKVGELVFSHKHRFAGTPDATGVHEGKNFVIDFKRTPEKHYFKQLAGYAIALEESGHPPFDGLMLIGVNCDTKQGFSKPVITNEVEQCKQMFLDARKQFKKLFLI